MTTFQGRTELLRSTAVKVRRKGYSIIRFSTPQQALGDSARRQYAQTQAYCAANNIELVETIRDEGKSGYHGVHRKRGAFGRFVKRFLAGDIEPGVLICEGFDRFTREPVRIAQQLFLTLINAGMDVYTTINAQYYSAETLDRDMGQLFSTIGLMLGAHMESKNKADRVREAWNSPTGRRNGGVGKETGLPNNNFPSWIVKTKDGPKLDRAKVRILHRVRRAVQETGLDVLAKQLNAEGVPLLSQRKRVTRTKLLWDKATLVKLIRGRQVLGEQAIGHYLEVKDEKTGETVFRRELTGEINKSAYPAAWSEEQWIEANAALNSRKRGVRTGRNVTYWTNLFGDVAICADCGSRMAIRGNGKQAGQRYFGCSNAGASGCSNRRYYRVDLLEEKVLAWRGDVLEKDFDTKQDDREGLLDEIADARAEARRLEKKYIEDNLNARTDLQKKALVAVHAEHEKELAKVRALEAKLTAVSKPVDVPATLRLMDRLRRMSGSKLIEARGKIAQKLPSIIERMRFMPDGVEVDYSNGVRLTTLRDGNDFLEIDERHRSMPEGIDATLDRLTIRGGGMPDHTQRVGRLNRRRKT